MQPVEQAFDRHAAGYDERFARHPLAGEIRAEVWALAESVLEPNARLLDLGAGTGEDAIHFARRGARVTALDISPAMIARIGEKAGAAGLSSQIDSVVARMEDWVPPPDAQYDGIVSGFGALNCASDLDWLRRLATGSLRSGGVLVLTTMGRIYPLEIVVHLLKAQPALAFRRFRRPCPVLVEGVAVDTRYPAPRHIGRVLGPGFRLEAVRGLRAWRPVPGFDHLSGYRLVKALEPLDRWFCAWRPTAAWADHFITVWRRSP